MAESESGGIVAGTVAALSALTSPSKLWFAAFVLFVYLGRFKPSACEFVWVVILFVLTQVLHDDFGRILLNNWANRLIPPPPKDPPPKKNLSD
jgi:hypothetical protein